MKSTKKNQIYLYAITNINTMKIFEVDLSAFKEPVRELIEMENCYTVGTCKLYPPDLLKLDAYSKSIPQIDMEIVANSIELLDDLAVVIQNEQITYLHRDKFIYSEKMIS